MNMQRSLRLAQRLAVVAIRRNVGVTSVAMNQMDPIQKLYLDQVISYSNQSNKLGGGPVDAGSDYDKMKQEAVARLRKVYDITDPNSFPQLNFKEPDLDQDSVAEE